MTVRSPEEGARLADARASLAAARRPAAAGPARDLRTAYLDLLKLCLCDLAGASTMSVGALEDGTVMSRELHGDERRLRVAGMDWPLHGLTMVGLARLDDLQTCIETIVADRVAGDVIEAGAWRGGASILMRATLDTLGDDRTVYVADSFEGFAAPAAADDGDPDLSVYEFLAVPLAEVRESFARLGCERRVEFVPGFFEETLSTLADRRWATVRLDGDTYEATRHALGFLYPGLATGGYLVIDDYGSFEGCRRAVDEFRREHGISEPIERIDHTGARWRRTDDAPIAPAPAGAAAPASRRRSTSRVPTARERELEHELAALRERLAAAEARVGLRGWLRGKAAR
jgi:O-methyltransferase